MSKQKITIFAISPDYAGYGFNYDKNKVLEYHKTHGYGFMLTFSRELADLVNELKAIKAVIDILNEWKSNDWFELNKTNYEINWFDCPRKNNKTEKTMVTLPQAKKLYQNTKAKYDLLIGIIQNTYEVHKKDSYGNEYCVNEFLSEIEI